MQARSEPYIVTHKASVADQQMIAAIRGMTAPFKGMMLGVEARVPFNAMMAQILAPENVSYRADIVGGIPGWWCRPENAQADEALLHLHSGWFIFGSAEGFRHLVGHIAKAAGVEAFVPDYRLAPENPFPAAVEDVQACYQGLVERGKKRLALTGDSAGGNLALMLLAHANAQAASGGLAPLGAVAISPVTDLALTGESWASRAEADPYFTKAQVVTLIGQYLGAADPTAALASPLYGVLAGLPPVRILVGDAETLLDDSLRYAARAHAAGVDVKAEIWEAMPHGFAGAVGRLAAAAEALASVGAFLAGLMQAARAA